MLFFYIRHGEPMYSPESLTALGEKQADAIAKRLALYGVDKIYVSPTIRATQTAKPTCDLLRKEMEFADFANENLVWNEITIVRNGEKKWIFEDEEIKNLFLEDSVVSLGHKWYEHEKLKEYKCGAERISKETFKFFKALGYEHINNTGKFKVIKPNDERVALFAHQGFGMAFLSEVLGIPFPIFSTHFNICHSGMTVIQFKEENGYAIPQVLTLSSDSHIYREGLPTKYNNKLYF